MQTPRTCSTAEALIAEYDAANANVMRRYVHGPGTDEPIVWYEGGTTANKNWLYSDHLGSVVATANTTGASTATYTYGPYGEPNTATGIRFRYTGQQLIGELGLYYYKARFYSPALGRFLQTDPIGYKDDQNLYAYVGSNSVNRTDPSGLAAKEAAALAARFGSAMSSNWSDSVAALQNDGLAGAAMKGLEGLPVAGAVAGGVGFVRGGATAAKAAATEASNIANAGRLAEQLTFQSAKSPFTAAGTLTQDAINGSKVVPGLEAGMLGNPAIPSGFGKYTTGTFQSPAGDFQMHFYKNPTTGEAFYGLDYKAIFNSMSGVQR